MADIVIINKVESAERCLKRVQEDYFGFEAEFETNFMRQDSIVLNIQRVCELSIDLANHLVRIHRLGIPKNSKEAFELLAKQDIISLDLANYLTRMVGFRNIAVYQYDQLDLAVVKSIITKHLDDFKSFNEIALSFV